MLYEEEICMIGSEEFRSIAERIASLSATQIRTSERVGQVIRDIASTRGSLGETKAGASNDVPPGIPNIHLGKPPEPFSR